MYLSNLLSPLNKVDKYKLKTVIHKTYYVCCSTRHEEPEHTALGCRGTHSPAYSITAMSNTQVTLLPSAVLQVAHWIDHELGKRRLCQGQQHGSRSLGRQKQGFNPAHIPHLIPANRSGAIQIGIPWLEKVKTSSIRPY